MKSIVEIVEEIVTLDEEMMNEENDKEWEYMSEECSNKIEYMWKNYKYDEIVKEINKYEIEKYELVCYMWKIREYIYKF